MNIYVAGPTALAYWAHLAIEDARRHRDAPPVSMRLDEWGLAPARVRSLASEVPADADLRARILDCMPLGHEPVHLLVGSRAARWSSPANRVHLWGRPVPADAFVRLSGSVYVATPEFAFRQMAYATSPARTLALGYELCGSYVQSSMDAAGFRPCTPLTSARQIRAFAANANSARLTRLAGYIADRAASPMETKLSIRLCSPSTMGSCGLLAAELNGRIELQENQPGGHLKCDMLWRDQAVAVEYDSDRFHTGPDRIARDSRRRNILLERGYRVITVTAAQYFDDTAFLEVARQIRAALGTQRTRHPARYDWYARFSALKAELNAEQAPWSTEI